jgi:hypothetical protein
VLVKARDKKLYVTIYKEKLQQQGALSALSQSKLEELEGRLSVQEIVKFVSLSVEMGIDEIQVPFGSTEGVVSTGVDSSSQRKEAGWLVAMDYIIWGKLI